MLCIIQSDTSCMFNVHLCQQPAIQYSNTTTNVFCELKPHLSLYFRKSNHSTEVPPTYSNKQLIPTRQYSETYQEEIPFLLKCQAPACYRESYTVRYRVGGGGIYVLCTTIFPLTRYDILKQAIPLRLFSKQKQATHYPTTWNDPPMAML